MADKMVTEHFCGTIHESLNKRVDRIDERLFWVLTFMIVTAFGAIGSLGVALVDKTQSPVYAAQPMHQDTTEVHR